MLRNLHRTARGAALLLLALVLLGGCSGDATSTASPPPQAYDSAEGWAVGGPADGYGVILHTRNGGATWERQGSPPTIADVPLSEIQAVSTLVAWAVGESDGNYATLLKTTDGGATWSRQGSASTLPDVQLSSLSAVDEGTAWVAGGGVILHTVDGGATWSRQGEGQVPSSQLSCVAALDARNAWLAGWEDALGQGFVFRTRDGGATWLRQDPTNPILRGQNPIDLFALDASTAWIVGTSEMAQQTRNGGKTWENICWNRPPTIAHANGVCGFDADTAWVAADYNILRSTSDGGATWREFNLSEIDKGDFWLLRVTGYTPKVLWVTGANPRGQTPKGGILHTRDGGLTWSLQTLPVDANLRGISFAGACR